MKHPSEEQKRRAEDIRAEYKHDSSGRITQPGRFEREPIFAPYYWDIGLDGFADSDDGRGFGFRFTNDGPDFELWPELKKWLGRKRTLKLFQCDMGFVYCR